ncbi:hypothetical protein E2C01_067125 [Portunus trituberculatus]|uniref:Uncharacterized protein n=1 Tax=Portunus trituberculatus TaxID=210409 RepID=A0A5B7HIZ7_PORTR|nr:hypothetical protein [Portunus trituberculatus]
MRTGTRYTNITVYQYTSNTVSKQYSGSCEKGDDRALYMCGRLIARYFHH